MVVERVGALSGTGVLRVTRIRPQVYAFVFQEVQIPAEHFGKTLVFSASLKADGVGPEGWMLLVNTNSLAGGFNQARSIPVVGSTGWQKIVLRTPIPPGTKSVSAGFMLLDAGTGWADDATLSVE